MPRLIRAAALLALAALPAAPALAAPATPKQTVMPENPEARAFQEQFGFSDEQMAGLLADAGFDPEAPIALADGELAVKIWVAQRCVAAGRKAS